MSKKFTEEQYRKIVELHDKRDFSVDGTIDVITYFVHNISRTGDADIDMALAISNPLTREWAHDKFVEKEKNYYWTSKKSDKDNEHCRLYRRINRSKGSGITSYFNRIGRFDNDMCEQLTESEIREWGYNPDMFDKEEVR